MSDSVQREWRFYVDDMICFAEKVIAYIKGFDQAGFARSQAPERAKKPSTASDAVSIRCVHQY